MLNIPAPLAAAIQHALGWHEVGNQPAVAYRLSFARIGVSGGSYGYLQNDAHSNPAALHTLDLILQGALVPVAQRGRILGELRNPAPSNPLSATDLAAVNAAINSTQGRALVDEMDAKTLAGLLAEVDRCIAAVSEQSAVIARAALIGMALWINQSGEPTRLLQWLGGAHVTIQGRIVPPVKRGDVIDEAAWLSYFGAIPFVVEHPNQLPRMVEAINVGLSALPDAEPAITA